MSESKTNTNDDWESLESVTAEPDMIVTEAMENLEDGRCAVAVDEDDRCPGDAEYKTTVHFHGTEKRVPLCEEHAEQGSDSEDSWFLAKRDCPKCSSDDTWTNTDDFKCNECGFTTESSEESTA